MSHINAVTKHMMKHMLSQYLAQSRTIIWDEACTLGSVFGRHGRYKQAMELYEQALAGYEKALGVDHLDTLRTVHHVAFVFDKQGQHEKALEWYQRALAGREKALGVNHPDTQNTLRGLVNLHESARKPNRLRAFRHA